MEMIKKIAFYHFPCNLRYPEITNFTSFEHLWSLLAVDSQNLK
jgi:hypothetical protein